MKPFFNSQSSNMAFFGKVLKIMSKRTSEFLLAKFIRSSGSEPRSSVSERAGQSFLSSWEANSSGTLEGTFAQTAT